MFVLLYQCFIFNGTNNFQLNIDIDTDSDKAQSDGVLKIDAFMMSLWEMKMLQCELVMHYFISIKFYPFSFINNYNYDWEIYTQPQNADSRLFFQK